MSFDALANISYSTRMFKNFWFWHNPPATAHPPIHYRKYYTRHENIFFCIANDAQDTMIITV